MKILVVNGPNLNLLGQREPEKYGTRTLTEIEEEMKAFVRDRTVQLLFFQSNTEGEIIDFLQKNAKGTDFVILNPGAFTHTSIALRDAILGLRLSVIEVHLTNIHGREEFRQKSYISDIAKGVITGLGWSGYLLALEYILKKE